MTTGRAETASAVTTAEPPAPPKPDTGLRRALRAATPRSVRVRILAWVVGLSILSSAGAGAAFYLVERSLIDQRITDSLAQEIEEFEAFAADGVDPATGETFTTPSRLMEVALGRNVPDENQALIAYTAGRPTFVQGAGVDALVRSPEFTERIGALPAGGAGTAQVGGGTVRYAVKVVQAASGDPAAAGAYVVAAFVDAERDELLDSVRTYALVALVALMAVALAAWSVAGRLLRPLRDLQATATQITHSDLTGRIEVTGTDDISDLARTFNDMLARLEDSFATQRRFLNDAGHELRTPITIVRGHLELMEAHDVDDVRTTRQIVLDELDRMSRLVEDLDVLARAERPDFLRPQTVNVGSLTDDLLDRAVGLGDRAWRLDERAEASIQADGQRLAQAVLQLAANAVRHTEVGDVIAIGSGSVPGRISLWVRDEGTGVDPADAERIFERFERGAQPSREGSGLGLSIVRAIATAHGGTVRLHSAPGAGATFVIELPADAAVETTPFPPVAAAREESSTW